MTEVQEIIRRWLDKAWAAGNRTPKNSAERSEYFAPLFDHKWAPEIEREIMAAIEKGKPVVFASTPYPEGEENRLLKAHREAVSDEADRFQDDEPDVPDGDGFPA